MMSNLLRYWLYIVFLTMMTFFFYYLITDANASEPEDVPKWNGYIDLLAKPGTVRNLGQGDLFVPIFQDKNDLTFFNLRGHLDEFDNSEYNIGMGHRHMYDKWIVGAYGYFDRRKIDSGNSFKQATFGVEALSEVWDVRFNAYFPKEEVKDKGTAPELIIENEKPMARYITEKALKGIDMELGYKIPLWEDTRIYLGGYNFSGGDDFGSVTGPRTRIETRLYDLPYVWEGSRLMLGLETQYDTQRGHQTAGLISFRIPLGTPSRKKPLTGLERRMIEPVVRDADVVFGTGKIDTPALNPTGKEYTKTVFMDSDKTVAEVNTAMQVLTDQGEVPLLIMKQDAANTPVEFGGKTINGGFTWLMAGTQTTLQSINPFTQEKQSFQNIAQGKTPIQSYSPAGSSALILKPDSHINGFTIDATNFSQGILIRVDPGNYYITNTKIMNHPRSGIRLEGIGHNLYITNSKIKGDYVLGGPDMHFSAGIYALNGPRVFADNVELLTNRGMGAFSMGIGSYIEIKNSESSANAFHGLASQDGGQMLADNLIIKNNGSLGVSSARVNSGIDSYIKITNSFITGSSFGLWAGDGGDIDGDNLIIKDNIDGGITAWGLDGVESLIRLSNSIIDGSGPEDSGASARGPTEASHIILDNVIFKNNILSSLYSEGSGGEITVNNSIFFDSLVFDDGGGEWAGSGNTDGNGNAISVP